MKGDLMNVNLRRTSRGTLVLALAVAVSLPGCGKKGSLEKAGAAADKAIEKARDATAEAAKSVGAAAEKAADATKEAARTVGAAAEKAATKTTEAVKAGGAAAEKAASGVKK
jgi:predicted small lipoprotein YifL